MIFKAKRKVGKNTYGKLDDQYARLWDYCETFRQTNKRSCVLMKVDTTNPDVPPTFQRLYLSLATMK